MNILKPKSPKQAIADFCIIYKCNDYDLKKLINKAKRDRRVIVWPIAIFWMIFGVSLIINGGIALNQNYFWLPISNARSMVSFINVFWIVCWFGTSISLIIYGISILTKAYDNV